MNEPLLSSPLAVPSTLRASTHVEALIGNSPIAIVALDGQHRFITANPAFHELFGYRPEDLLGRDFDSTIAAPGMEGEARHLSSLVLQGTKVNLITQRRRCDGTTVDVEISGIPLIEDGSLAGVYALYLDLTAKTKAENALKAMVDRVEAAQELERRRIARELHDSTSQELTALIWNLRRLNRLVVGQDEEIRNLVQQTQEIATQCSARIRSASYLLHPPELHAGGLTQALPSLTEGFEQRSGIFVDLAIGDGFGRFRDDVELTLFRIVQEGLTNVLRHSTSSRVDIALNQQHGKLLLCMCDDGICPPLTARAHGQLSGVGLSGMRERVELLGGTFRVTHEIHGTSLSATLPADTRLLA